MILLLCIVLFGCSSGSDLNSQLDKVFSADRKEETLRRNNYSTYLDYYLPSDIFELESGMLTNYFLYDDSRLIMDVNVSGIVNDRYYPEEQIKDEGFFDEDKLVYAHSGVYVDNEGSEHEYLYKVYGYEENYLTYFVSRDLIFYGYAEKEDVVGLSSRILLLAKGTIVREDAVAAGYSLKNEIDYEKKQVNLFETIMPVNGNVNDFVIGDDVDGQTE